MKAEKLVNGVKKQVSWKFVQVSRLPHIKIFAHVACVYGGGGVGKVSIERDENF